MRALLLSIVLGVLSTFSTVAFATYSSSGGDSGSYTRIEYDNFYLYHRSNPDFGDPVVTGNSILFFPDDMSVSGHHYDSSTWTTTIAIKPKEGFDISTLTLTEQGDYAYSPGSYGGEALFDINARFFIRDKFDPSDYDFLKLDETITTSDPVDFEDWSVSDTFDISDFADGFYLTIQNTLTIKGSKHRPENSDDEWLRQWHDNESDKDILACLTKDYEGKKKYYRDFLKDIEQHKEGEYGNLFLQKKFIGIDIGTSEVPLPASAWLFISALGLVQVARRR